MKIKSILRFYRIIGFKEKMTGVGNFGYVIFGYAISGRFAFLPLFLNGLAVFLGVLFAFAINNFFDWKTQKEKNFLGEKIEEGKLKENQALFLCFLPLGIAFFVIFFSFFKNYISLISLFLFLVLSLLSLFYALPPIRLKKRKIIGFLAVPMGALLIFLEGYFVLAGFNFFILFLTILFFLFEIYLEVIHCLEDSLYETEVIKIGRQKAMKLLNVLPLISLLTSLIFSFFCPLFLITSFFSVVRIISLKNFKMEDLWRIRRNYFSLQTSFYEYFLYGIFGFFGIIEKFSSF